MKTNLVCLTAFCLTVLTSFAKTQIETGPALYARAMESIAGGSYTVSSEGLKKQHSAPLSYGKVRTKSELAAPILKTTFPLEFVNYKTWVYEEVSVWDKSGTPLFQSYNSWEPVEHIAPNGGKLTYTMPEEMGRVELHLADQRVHLEGDSLAVQFDYGYTMNLYVDDYGDVVIPGYVFSRNGAFIERDGTQTYVTDIQTGLPITSGKEVSTSTVTVDGIETAVPAGLNLTITDIDQWNNPLYEVSVANVTGNMIVRAQSDWVESPAGAWVTVVGEGKDSVYYPTSADKTIVVPVKAGQVLHFRFYWNKQQNVKG